MKKNLLKKVLLNAVLGGALLLPNFWATGAEAADFKYKIDDGEEQTWDGSSDLIGTGTKLEVWGPGTITPGCDIYGGKASDTDVTGKKVITSGRILTSIYGGYSWNGYVTGNTVIISGGSVVNVYGGHSWNGNATGNIVTVSGGSVVDVYGGFASDGNATNNTVTINGGLVELNVYGGYSSYGNATNNTVTINGGSVKREICGGYTYSGTSSNNTLNLKIKMGSKATNVKFFQIMNFILPSNITNGDVMLETASVTYDNTTIGVDAANGVKLNSGDVITLIKADNINSTTIGNDGESVLGGAGVISMDDNNLILTMLQDFEQKAVIGGGGNDDQQKAPVEAIAGSVAMLNQSADLALGEGLASLLANTLQTEEKETEPANENNSNIATSPVVNTFGAVTANRSKYKTGSHVDMDGWGVIVGAGTTKNWSNCTTTTYGVFFEYGKGDFDTYNNDIHGEGDSKNEGVGIMARHTLKNNTYFDANIRYGKQETEWSESEIGGYDTDSRYSTGQQ